jgi:hypothetical protein
MNLLWTPNAWEEYLHRQTADPKVLESINTLIEDIRRDPFKGLGKPEPFNMTCRDIGRGASPSNTVWSTGWSAAARAGRSRSFSAGITISL